jgi:hypothetical protein
MSPTGNPGPVTTDEAKGKARKEPRYRRPSDEQVLGAAMKVLIRKGTVGSQRELASLVVRELRKTDPLFTVSPERVRALVVRSGTVAAEIRTRNTGPTPELAKCPVCGGKLQRRANRTLTGATTPLGYRCTKCPWWTGRDMREPHRYAFYSRFETGNGKQTAFREGWGRDDR